VGVVAHRERVASDDDGAEVRLDELGEALGRFDDSQDRDAVLDMVAGRRQRRSVVGQRQILAFSGVDGLRCVSADGRAIPLHVDGDHIGDVTEAVFEVRPGALGVVA